MKKMLIKAHTRLYQKTVLNCDALFQLHLVSTSTPNESQDWRQDQSLDGFAHVNPLICTESGEKAQWRPFGSKAKVLPDLCTFTQELFLSFPDSLTFKAVWFFPLIDLSFALTKEKRSAAFWVGHRCHKSYRRVSKTSRLVLKSDGGIKKRYILLRYV